MGLFHSLGTKSLAVAAALLLTAACASNKSDSATSSGQASGSQVAQGQSGGPVPGTEEHFLVNVQDRIFFDLDRYDLNAASREVVARQAAWLKQYPNAKVVVEGHCDERGTREYNLALGSRRATAVKDYLVSLGIQPSRVRTISFGKERPVAPGSNNAAWRLNRRGVTVIEAGLGS